MLRLGAERHRLVWAIHPILSDGWSLTTCLAEVAQAYEALERGEDPAPTRGRPYGEYVEWVRSHVGAAPTA